MAQITIRVENRSGKQTVSILERNRLTAMQMPGQNQVIALLTRSFPDARVVRAQNLKITLGQRRRVGAGHGNHSRTMRYSSGAGMNPLSPAAHDRVADSIHTDMSVVVAAHGEDRRCLAERADQIAKFA